jgi:hypothetical protein
MGIFFGSCTDTNTHTQFDLRAYHTHHNSIHIKSEEEEGKNWSMDCLPKLNPLKERE